MDIGIISDIHSNAPALSAVLDQLDRENVANIFCAGDVVGYYTRPSETISLLRGKGIHSVKGNHDAAVAGETPQDFSLVAQRGVDWNRRNISPLDLGFLDNLPLVIDTWIEGNRIVIAHGSPKNPLTEYVFQEQIDQGFLKYNFNSWPDVLILGHTHRPYVKRIKDTLVVNPGSVGQPRDGDWRPSYAVLRGVNEDAEVHRVEYPWQVMFNEALDHLPRELAERLVNPDSSG